MFNKQKVKESFVDYIDFFEGNTYFTNGNTSIIDPSLFPKELMPILPLLYSTLIENRWYLINDTNHVIVADSKTNVSITLDHSNQDIHIKHEHFKSNGLCFIKSNPVLMKTLYHTFRSLSIFLSRSKVLEDWELLTNKMYTV